MNKFTEVAEEMGFEVRRNELLRDHTTFKLGGPCDMFVVETPGDCARLIKFLQSLGEDYFILGKGSNIIATDNGTTKPVIKLGNGFAVVKADGELLHCGAAASISQACRTALHAQLSGLEFAYGIPGSIGGAIYMNAGAYDGEMSDVVAYVEAIEKKTGKTVRLSGDELDFSYRHSVFMKNEYIITDVTFRLKPGVKSEIKDRMAELIEKRRSKQPIEFPSAGSTFKRPEGAYAAQLIEQCGLKGLSVGDAQVSTKHCGFIINRGDANYGDVSELIEKVRSTVKEKTGYTLELEPILIGD